MPSGHSTDGLRVTMMRCSTGDRGEVRFVGIPQGQPPVVEDDQIGLGKADQELGEASVPMGQG
jgi:hypothetical protein